MAEREGYRGYRPRTDALATKAKIVIDEAVGNRNHATLLAHGVHVLMFHACPSCLVYPRRGRLARQRRGGGAGGRMRAVKVQTKGHPRAKPSSQAPRMAE